MRSSKIALSLCATLMLASVGVATQGQKKKPAPKPAANAALIAQGQKTYKAATCGACHIMDGKGGKTGPELTHIGKTMTADKLATYIRNPKKVKPDAAMPPTPTSGATGLTDAQLKAVAAFLASKK